MRYGGAVDQVPTALMRCQLAHEGGRLPMKVDAFHARALQQAMSLRRFRATVCPGSWASRSERCASQRPIASMAGSTTRIRGPRLHRLASMCKLRSIAVLRTQRLWGTLESRTGAAFLGDMRGCRCGSSGKHSFRNFEIHGQQDTARPRRGVEHRCIPPSSTLPVPHILVDMA
jgi:hypothetical protein